MDQLKLDFLQNPIVAGIVAGVITLVVGMLYSKFKKEEFNLAEYAKCILYVSGIVTVMLYLGCPEARAVAEDIMTDPF